MPSKSTPKRATQAPAKTVTLQARVTAEFREKAEGLAKRRNERVTDLVLKAVHRELVEAGQAGASPDVPPVDVDADDTKTVRVTVSLPSFIKKAVDQRAAAADRKTATWLAALVQTSVMRDPVLLDPELAAIERTNRELAALGRNLNQVARALNEAHYQTERLKIEKLGEVAEAVAESRKAIRALLRASRQVWIVES